VTVGAGTGVGIVESPSPSSASRAAATATASGSGRSAGRTWTSPGTSLATTATLPASTIRASPPNGLETSTRPSVTATDEPFSVTSTVNTVPLTRATA
jgi:hypothetical protein